MLTTPTVARAWRGHGAGYEHFGATEGAETVVGKLDYSPHPPVSFAHPECTPTAETSRVGRTIFPGDSHRSVKTIFDCVEVQMYAPQRPCPGFNGIGQFFPCAACPCPVSPARYGSPAGGEWSDTGRCGAYIWTSTQSKIVFSRRRLTAEIFVSPGPGGAKSISQAVRRGVAGGGSPCFSKFLPSGGKLPRNKNLPPGKFSEEKARQVCPDDTDELR
eukprot:gene11901-biopygen12447